jgi:hypothetical protein
MWIPTFATPGGAARLAFGALLRLDTRFKLAYEDAVAAVFVAASLSEAGAATALSREGEYAHTAKEVLP